MEVLLNRKAIISLLLAIILTIIVIVLLLSPKPPINENGKGKGKLPGIVVGANGAKEGIKKAVNYCFKQISSKRHAIQNLGKHSQPHSKLNTVVDKKVVNLVKDVKDINSGLATRTGNVFKLPNGNVYKAKSITEGANLIPIQGKGMYTLSRAEYNILKQLKLKGGVTDDFYKWFSPQTKIPNPFTQKDLKNALDIYSSVLK